MSSLYELDSEPEDTFTRNDNASETSESLLEESVSFMPPWSRPKKRPIVSREWKIASLVTSLIVLVVFTVAITSSIRKQPWKPPVSNDPNVEYLQPQYFQSYNSQRVRIKYGPYEVPSSNIDNGMANFYNKNATMPCHDCLVTLMQADLIYEDGTPANADTGMWLHHTVLTNSGSTDVKGCDYHGERFFASGNERTLVDLSMAGTSKTGYHISATDNVWMMTELMNTHASSRSAILTITYEYIPTPPPPPPPSAAFERVTSIWLDIGGCGRSDMPVPSHESTFHFESPAWKATIAGRVICVLGHLHDGGTVLDVRRGGEEVCKSVAGYVEEEDADVEIGRGGVGRRELEAHHGGGNEMSHIVQMSMCHDVGRIEKGEEWTVRADYDIAAHPPMLDSSGDPEGVMGIAVMYVVED